VAADENRVEPLERRDPQRVGGLDGVLHRVEPLGGDF
jgi:hypothetical protein